MTGKRKKPKPKGNAWLCRDARISSDGLYVLFLTRPSRREKRHDGLWYGGLDLAGLDSLLPELKPGEGPVRVRVVIERV